MSEINRRDALLMGLASTVVGAHLAVNEASAQAFGADDVEPSMGADATWKTARASAEGPIEYWNDVGLLLNAYDHSIEAPEARAPGPVASARALGLMHLVMADAVALAYPDPLYEPYLHKTGLAKKPAVPAMFVGGACAAILAHIYNNGPKHLQAVLTPSQNEFIERYGSNHLPSWDAGWQFGKDAVFTVLWDWTDIQSRIDPMKHNYQPNGNEHRFDPYNPDQGYYGHSWGVGPKPISLSEDEVTKNVLEGGCAPPNPPAPGSIEYSHDEEDVFLNGAFHGDVQNPLRMAEQFSPGTFWAYDGANLLGTPPKLYNRLVRAVAKKDGLGPRRLARVLALCNIAMSDAGNVAWHAKYHHRIWRPVRGLNPALPDEPTKADIKWTPLGSPRTNRAFDGGRNLQAFSFDATAPGVALTQSIIAGKASPAASDPDPEYKKAAFTPNFPAYPSGHATFGAACFEMLVLFRGERIADPRRVRIESFVSEELDGLAVDNFVNETRQLRSEEFSNLEEVIADNNRSRVLLGVHWQFDAKGGEFAGRKVAETVYQRAYREA